MTTQIGNVCSNLHNRIHNIRLLTDIADFQTRKKNFYKITLHNTTIHTTYKKQLSRIHKVIMTAARAIIGNYCFKKSTSYILDKCDLLTAKQAITYAAIKFTHKTITNRLPKANYQMYMEPNKRTKHNTIRTKIRPKTKKLKLHIINKGADLTNNIPLQSSP